MSRCLNTQGTGMSQPDLKLVTVPAPLYGSTALQPSRRVRQPIERSWLYDAVCACVLTAIFAGIGVMLAWKG